ncbi:MAG: PAS domain S-box protein [Janthinobacterium lividum]
MASDLSTNLTDPDSLQSAAVQMHLRAADILENITDAFVALDRDWRIVYANPEACRINQKPLEEFVGKIHWDEWPGAVGTELERHYRYVMETREAAHFEHRYVSGPYDVWLENDAYPSEDGINIFYRDISKRKAAEQVLHQFQFLSDHANDAFFLMDVEGHFVYVNETACQSLGYSAEQFQHMRPLDIDPNYDDTQFRALFLRADGERLPPFESLQRRADGSSLPIEASVSRLNVSGKALLFSSCRDITERKKAEEAHNIAASQQRLFLRDVLASVTENRLHLCFEHTDLPDRLWPRSEWIPLSQTSGLWELRHKAQDTAIAQGFTNERWQDLVTAASEAAMNAVVHAGEGRAQVCGNGDNVVQVWVEDRGQGIDVTHLPRATLEKGFTTAGTLGHGMKMMLQTADRVYLLTGSFGTTVVAEQDRIASPSIW